MKKKLLISFSGGRTSAFMMWYLTHIWEERHLWDIKIVYANTGKESAETLFFVDECANEWGLEIIWVEAKTSDKGKGWSVSHNVVNYETASRNGEPFENMIKRLGIPSTNAPFCSKQLKRLAIISYLKSVGWKEKDYITAIGYRADEPKRYQTKKGIRKAATKNMILPLVDIFPVDKQYIEHWFNKQAINLTCHPDEGNCDNCWKKDMPRLVRNATRNPNSFDWWQLMTDQYGYLNPRNSDLKPPFNFYRGNVSPRDILKMAKEKSQAEIKIEFPEFYSSCQESCEAF